MKKKKKKEAKDMLIFTILKMGGVLFGLVFVLFGVFLA